MDKIKIGKFEISETSPCFVIAEIGHNHQVDLETAKKLIDEAAACGAQAVKLQKRFNKTLYTKAMYNRLYDNENSFGRTYGEHREALEFDKEEYLELKAYAHKKHLVFFATAFDFESVEFLEEIEVPAYKIASADLTHHSLVEYIAKKKKPIFLSTGASRLEDVKEAYEIVRKYNHKICIMQCTSCYPANPEDLHLNVIRTYKREFPEAIIGYSSHDNGIVMPVIAYILGARVVEKHFTLNRAMKGTDHKFSLEPVGLRKMVRDLNRAYVALGSEEKRCYPLELEAKEKMGKSIVTAREVRQGEIITEEMIAFKSPGNGILPSYTNISKILGKKLKVNLPEDTSLEWSHFE